MRYSGLALVLIALAVGLVMVGTKSVSIIKGSHDVSSHVNCSSCHRHVAEEMAITRALHGPHWDLSCVTCHRFNGTGIKFANATASSPGMQAHAAYVPSCLDCHGGKGVWVVNVSGVLVHAPPARAFNVTTKVNGRNVTVVDSIPYFTAHKQLIAYCIKQGDENLACLACHTNYSVNISYSYPDYINLIISSWNITSLTIGPDRVYNVSFVKKTLFSGKHVFLPLKDINCSKCHLNIYLGLINGKHAPIYYAWRWGNVNLWGFYRYHGLALYGSTLNTSWINNTYCNECHRALKVTLVNYKTGVSYTFDISKVTNASSVHCAEKVSCLTCHHRNSTYWWLDPYYAFLNATKSNPLYAPYHEDLINQTAKYPRFIHGDICLDCHMAAYHWGSCDTCHTGYNKITTQYTEP